MPDQKSTQHRRTFSGRVRGFGLNGWSNTSVGRYGTASYESDHSGTTANSTRIDNVPLSKIFSFSITSSKINISATCLGPVCCRPGWESMTRKSPYDNKCLHSLRNVKRETHKGSASHRAYFREALLSNRSVQGMAMKFAHQR